MRNIVKTEHRQVCSFGQKFEKTKRTKNTAVWIRSCILLYFIFENKMVKEERKAMRPAKG